jgi:hypothetical protein
MSELKKMLEIDVDALDVEWIRHPAVFMEVSEELADARTKLDKLKFKLDVMEADEEKDIRENPEDRGIAKLTEGLVKSALASAPKLQAFKTKIIDQQHEVNLLASCVGALEHKKRALEKLVILHGQQYFAGPAAPRASKALADDMVKQRARTRRNREE